jgi:hypothetical protein
VAAIKASQTRRRARATKKTPSPKNALTAIAATNEEKGNGDVTEEQTDGDRANEGTSYY